ncbi:MAG: cytochrome c biogenesis protein CcsA [Phycisphaerales bacterium]|nr:cytochrome c biogenesis protein CcsA [Phycisphaerales bacterium]
MSSSLSTTIVRLYWLATLLLFAAVAWMLVFWTPREASMGDVQKIFYIHLPAAIHTFVACFVVFVGSVMYLLQRRLWWDDVASAAAKVSVLLASLVLLTGMVWGRSAWGHWWTWSPRLTFSLILWLLYVVYLVIRPSIESSQKRALISAVYGVIAFLDVPLVYLSTKLLPDIHPKEIVLTARMGTTLLAWFAPMTMLAAGLIVVSFRINRLRRTSLEEVETEFEEPRLVPAGGNA